MSFWKHKFKHIPIPSEIFQRGYIAPQIKIRPIICFSSTNLQLHPTLALPKQTSLVVCPVYLDASHYFRCHSLHLKFSFIIISLNSLLFILMFSVQANFLGEDFLNPRARSNSDTMIYSYMTLIFSSYCFPNNLTQTQFYLF